MRKIFLYGFLFFTLTYCKRETSATKKSSEISKNIVSKTENNTIQTEENFILPEKAADTTDWQKDKLFHKVKMVHLKEDFLGNNGMDNDSLVSHSVYCYNSDGYKTEYLYNDSCCSGFYMHYFYSYKQKGILKEAKIYNIENNLVAKILYTYNDKNLLTKEVEYSVGNEEKQLNLERKTTYKYDEKNNEIECLTDGAVDYRKYVYLRNHQGYVTEEKCYESVEEERENSYVSDTYKYNKQGFVEENISTAYPKGDFQWRRTYKYDEKGLIVEQNEYRETKNKLHETTSIEYTFDKYGNWIRKQEYRNGKKSTTSVRKIEYYDQL